MKMIRKQFLKVMTILDQVRVVTFYVSSSPLPPSLLRILVLASICVQFWLPRSQPRASAFSVRCRTSAASICAQCSPPDLKREHVRSAFATGPQPRPVFAAGPEPRASPLSVRYRISTAITRALCSLPDLNREHPRPVFAAGPQRII